MSEEKKIATRESFGRALEELGHTAKDMVVLDADLANATKTCYFQESFPERYVECGIAESNMMDVAAGLSTVGLVPFASTFAMFAAGRAYEQIRNTIGYPHLNVKIGATHGGITVGEDGASHQCLEDFALMRTIPRMTVLAPVDDPEARAMVKTAYEYDGPFYIRFSRSASPIIHEDDYRFVLGKGEVLRQGKDIALISTGFVTASAVKACEILAENGIDATLIHMGTIKPIDKPLLKETAKKVKAFVSIEEHNIIGGLGDAVAEAIEDNPVPLKRIGIEDVFGHSGSASELLKEYKLDGEGIAHQVMEWLKDTNIQKTKEVNHNE